MEQQDTVRGQQGSRLLASFVTDRGADMPHDDREPQELRQRLAHARVVLLCEAGRWNRRPAIAQVYEDLYVELAQIELEPYPFMAFARLANALAAYTLQVDAPTAVAGARHACAQVIKALMEGTPLPTVSPTAEALA